jgi:hypothetical protein
MYHRLSHASAAADDLAHGPLRIYAQVAEFRRHDLPKKARGDLIVCWGEDEEEVAQVVRSFVKRGKYSSYRVRYTAGPLS